MKRTSIKCGSLLERNRAGLILHEYGYCWKSGDSLLELDYHHTFNCFSLWPDKTITTYNDDNIPSPYISGEEFITNPEKYLGGRIKNYFNLEDIA